MPPELVKIFIDSDIARVYGEGNPKYVAGRTGCELLRDALWALNLPEPLEKDVIYLYKSQEFWAGWASAYYQWKRSVPYEQLFAEVPIEKIMQSFYPLEASIERFVSIMDKWRAEPDAENDNTDLRDI